MSGIGVSGTSDNIILNNPVSKAVSNTLDITNITNITDNLQKKVSSGKGGAIAFILAIILVGYVLYIIVNLHYKKADIINNWGKNRCNVGIIPIAGWIKPIGKNKYVGLSGTMHNFEYCVDTMTNSIMKIILEPFLIIINKFLDLCKDIFDMITGLYNKFENTHFNIFSFLSSLFDQIKEVKNGLIYVNEKLDSFN